MNKKRLKPVVIRKISDLRDNQMSLGLFCLACDRWGEIIPEEWLSSGKKDVDYINQRFECGVCGESAAKKVRSTSSQMFQTNSLIRVFQKSL